MRPHSRFIAPRVTRRRSRTCPRRRSRKRTRNRRATANCLLAAEPDRPRHRAAATMKDDHVHATPRLLHPSLNPLRTDVNERVRRLGRSSAAHRRAGGGPSPLPSTRPRCGHRTPHRSTARAATRTPPPRFHRSGRGLVAGGGPREGEGLPRAHARATRSSDAMPRPSSSRTRTPTPSRADRAWGLVARPFNWACGPQTTKDSTSLGRARATANLTQNAPA